MKMVEGIAAIRMVLKEQEDKISSLQKQLAVRDERSAVIGQAFKESLEEMRRSSTAAKSEEVSDNSKNVV